MEWPLYQTVLPALSVFTGLHDVDEADGAECLAALAGDCARLGELGHWVRLDGAECLVGTRSRVLGHDPRELFLDGEFYAV